MEGYYGLFISVYWHTLMVTFASHQCRLIVRLEKKSFGALLFYNI